MWRFNQPSVKSATSLVGCQRWTSSTILPLYTSTYPYLSPQARQQSGTHPHSQQQLRWQTTTPAASSSTTPPPSAPSTTNPPPSPSSSSTSYTLTYPPSRRSPNRPTMQRIMSHMNKANALDSIHKEMKALPALPPTRPKPRQRLVPETPIRPKYDAITLQTEMGSILTPVDENTATSASTSTAADASSTLRVAKRYHTGRRSIQKFLWAPVKTAGATKAIQSIKYPWLRSFQAMRSIGDFSGYRVDPETGQIRLDAFFEYRSESLPLQVFNYLLLDTRPYNGFKFTLQQRLNVLRGLPVKVGERGSYPNFLTDDLPGITEHLDPTQLESVNPDTAAERTLDAIYAACRRELVQLGLWRMLEKFDAANDAEPLSAFKVLGEGKRIRRAARKVANGVEWMDDDMAAAEEEDEEDLEESSSTTSSTRPRKMHMRTKIVLHRPWANEVGPTPIELDSFRQQFEQPQKQHRLKRHRWTSWTYQDWTDLAAVERRIYEEWKKSGAAEPKLPDLSSEEDQRQLRLANERGLSSPYTPEGRARVLPDAPPLLPSGLYFDVRYAVKTFRTLGGEGSKNLPPSIDRFTTNDLTAPELNPVPPPLNAEPNFYIHEPIKHFALVPSPLEPIHAPFLFLRAHPYLQHRVRRTALRVRLYEASVKLVIQQEQQRHLSFRVNPTDKQANEQTDLMQPHESEALADENDPEQGRGRTKPTGGLIVGAQRPPISSSTSSASSTERLSLAQTRRPYCLTQFGTREYRIDWLFHRLEYEEQRLTLLSRAYALELEARRREYEQAQQIIKQWLPFDHEHVITTKTGRKSLKAKTPKVKKPKPAKRLKKQIDPLLPPITRISARKQERMIREHMESYNCEYEEAERFVKETLEELNKKEKEQRKAEFLRRRQERGAAKKLEVKEPAEQDDEQQDEMSEPLEEDGEEEMEEEEEDQEEEAEIEDASKFAFTDLNQSTSITASTTTTVAPPPPPPHISPLTLGFSVSSASRDSSRLPIPLSTSPETTLEEKLASLAANNPYVLDPKTSLPISTSFFERPTHPVSFLHLPMATMPHPEQTPKAVPVIIRLRAEVVARFLNSFRTILVNIQSIEEAIREYVRQKKEEGVWDAWVEQRRQQLQARVNDPSFLQHMRTPKGTMRQRLLFDDPLSFVQDQTEHMPEHVMDLFFNYRVRRGIPYSLFDDVATYPPNEAHLMSDVEDDLPFRNIDLDGSSHMGTLNKTKARVYNKNYLDLLQPIPPLRQPDGTMIEPKPERVKFELPRWCFSDRQFVIDVEASHVFYLHLFHLNPEVEREILRILRIYDEQQKQKPTTPPRDDVQLVPTSRGLISLLSDDRNYEHLTRPATVRTGLLPLNQSLGMCMVPEALLKVPSNIHIFPWLLFDSWRLVIQSSFLRINPTFGEPNPNTHRSRKRLQPSPSDPTAAQITLDKQRIEPEIEPKTDETHSEL